MIAASVFACTRIGVPEPGDPEREASATSFQRGQTKNARSFFFAIGCVLQRRPAATPDIAYEATPGGDGRPYFTSAKKPGVGIAPMTACLVVFAAVAAAP